MNRPVRQRFGNLIKRALFAVNRLLDRISFPGGDLGSIGISVSPVTYYSPVTSRRWLAENPEMWQRRTALPGVDWDLDSQFAWLESCTADYIGEVGRDELTRGVEDRGIRFKYGPIEAEILHCVIRAFSPKRILELGSGASTAVMSDAAARNLAEGRSPTKITAVDPFASEALYDLDGVEIRSEHGQMLPISEFASLESGDLLFIDSSHAVKTGSELPRIYLEGIPSLAPGVLIHVHDVFLPYLFRPQVLDDFWDFQESALLAALLTDNSKIEVLCAMAALHDADPARFTSLIPDFDPGTFDRGISRDASAADFPSSIWLRTR